MPHTVERITSCDDDALVARAKLGEEAAFSELWRRQQRRVFLAVRRIVQHHEDAEDVMQDVCVKAWLHLGTFDGRAKFSTWLTSIAINSALMSLRKKKRHQHLPIETSPDFPVDTDLDFADRRPSAEALLIQHERSTQLHQAIERLPLSLRSALDQQLVGQSCAKDLAHSFGISSAAMKSRLFRARKSLVRSLRPVNRHGQTSHTSA